MGYDETVYCGLILKGDLHGAMEYLSFGKISTGGWTDDNGVINCVKSSYDLTSEDFSVSLLKHEAQHARDLKEFGALPSDELEYRAKLVELIYSVRRNLIPQFIREADSSGGANGHTKAAYRIINGFKNKLNKSTDALYDIPIWQVRQIAEKLFAESSPVNAAADTMGN